MADADVAMPSEGTREQLETLSALRRKLTAMPARAVSDGFSIRDHDQILYGASGKSGLIIRGPHLCQSSSLWFTRSATRGIHPRGDQHHQTKGPFWDQPPKGSLSQMWIAAPAIRQPANLSQTLWGGWSCPQCGIEIDKWGNQVEPNQ